MAAGITWHAHACHDCKACSQPHAHCCGGCRLDRHRCHAHLRPCHPGRLANLFASMYGFYDWQINYEEDCPAKWKGWLWFNTWY